MRKIAELTKQANRFLSLWGVGGCIAVEKERAPIPIYWGGNDLGKPSLTFRFDRWEIAAYFNGNKQVIVTDWMFHSALDSGKVVRELSNANRHCHVANSQRNIYFSLPFLLALRAYTIYLEKLGTSHVFYNLQPRSITLEWFAGGRVCNAFKVEIFGGLRRARLFVNRQEIMRGKASDILRTTLKMIACFNL